MAIKKRSQSVFNIISIVLIILEINLRYVLKIKPFNKKIFSNLNAIRTVFIVLISINFQILLQ